MKKILSLIVLLIPGLFVLAQKEKLAKTSAGFPVNYEEDSVGSYTLPDVLTMANGQPVSSAAAWTSRRRPELVKLFEEIEYGKMPPRPEGMHFTVFDKNVSAFVDGIFGRDLVPIFRDQHSDARVAGAFFIVRRQKNHVAVQARICAF